MSGTPMALKNSAPNSKTPTLRTAPITPNQRRVSQSRLENPTQLASSPAGKPQGNSSSGVEKPFVACTTTRSASPRPAWSAPGRPTWSA